MARNNGPASRLDSNDRLRADYRSPYITAMVERARRAGVPADALAYDDETGNAWYSELVIRCSLLARGLDPEKLTGHARVAALRENEDTLRFGLLDLCGIEESPATGQLVPSFSRFFGLQERTRANAGS